MCTLLILFRPDHKWPLIIAGNRDEILERKWEKPFCHWPKYPSVLAGKDLLGGGTWLGINKYGMVATVLNRTNSIGPSQNKNTRGVLPLKILKHDNIRSAIDEISSINCKNWKSFNLFFGDNKNAYWAKNTGKNEIIITKINKGKHFLDSYDLDSFRSPKLKYNYKDFCESTDPDPSIDDWKSWKKILTNKRYPEGIPLAAINISKKNNKGYGTSSSSIIAIPSDKEKYNNNSKPIFFFNSGPPEKNNFYSITT
jgi:uncharacterized protein with NRDE domain